MSDYTRSFKKIVPYLRSTTMDVIEKQVIKGEKLEIPSDGVMIEVYLHRSKAVIAPVLFELHGGGFVLGHAAKDDALCELIKERLDIHVVGINYRKAPENPYPAAINDVIGVMKYFAENAEQYGMDSLKFAVMGYSAGANLATVAAMQLKDEENLNLACQILHYPFLDAVTDPFQKEMHPADLPCEVMEAFNELYAPEEDRALPWISPVYATEEQLYGVAPAVIITAKEDALCKEGLHYAELLGGAGVPVDARAMKQAHHGYIEDYYNKECFDTVPEDTKAALHVNFGAAAQEAIEITMQKLEEYLK